MKQKQCSLKPLVDIYQQPHPLEWARLFGNNHPVTLEIGFGFGEVLVRSARQHPEHNYVGLEQIWERIYRTLKSIAKTGETEKIPLDNICIMRADARTVFERLIRPRSLAFVYALFPCPWPKKGHIKHRLFSHSFLKLLNSRLADNGRVQVVTDFKPFEEWVIEQTPQTGFRVTTRIIDPRFETKFEKKWREQGQQKFFEIELVKQEHIDEPLKEAEPLKTYRISDFDPEHFKMDSLTGETAVIFKDFLFDERKKKGLVHVIVSERELSQSIRVAVNFKKDFWTVGIAEGQSFFPTGGIAKAIEIVYEAAGRSNAKS